MSARYAAQKARIQKTQMKALPAPESAKKAIKAPSKAPPEKVSAKQPRRVLRCPCTGLGCSRIAFFTNPKFKEHALCTRCLRAAKRSLKEQKVDQKVIETDTQETHEDNISESVLVAEAHEADSCLFPANLKPIQRKIALSRILVDGHFTLDKTVWDGCSPAFGGYEQMMSVYETVMAACGKSGAIQALT